VRKETEAWLASAESDAGAARLLLANGFYAQAVFFTHLWVEKTLKAGVIEHLNLGRPPVTHNLVSLIETIVPDPPEWLFDFLVRLSPESTGTRYTLSPENEVYTIELAESLLGSANEAIQWLQQQLT
jgi:HEPN domain-containing protein